MTEHHPHETAQDTKLFVVLKAGIRQRVHVGTGDAAKEEWAAAPHVDDVITLTPAAEQHLKSEGYVKDADASAKLTPPRLMNTKVVAHG